MIDIGQLRFWMRTTIQIGYLVWVVVVAILTLILVIFDAFDLCGVNINAEMAILIAIVIVAPMMPFVQKFALPGGGGFSWPTSRQAELTKTLREGTELGEIAIEEFDLNKIIRGDL